MKKIILIVEDSMSIRRFINLALSMNKDYKVLQASDGIEALEKMSVENIDLLLTDLNMPNMDGLTLIKNVRKDKEFFDLPIIILSSLVKDEYIEAGMASGANSYLVKPFNKKKLLYEVSKYLD
jgi:two-component system, chemotaxis family, chemotaxis protein CheY